jgi:hypothetical protein
MTLPVKMVAPGDKREGIWRQGILQIHVTRACDLSCHHCTQGSNLAGKPVLMSPDQFDAALASLEGYFGVVGMFGGNPCVHPQFPELCAIMRARIPWEQRGLWSNNLRGRGGVCRITFNPRHSNLNVHLSAEARAEIARDWPEAVPFVKGAEADSIHGAPFVAMRDVIPEEAERWRLIGDCDVNRYWSAMLCIVRGELRAFFCELAGAQAMLHQDNPDWLGTGAPMPDTGLEASPGWWRLPIESFAEQVTTHCHSCGIPLRRPGQLAVGGRLEEYSATHRFIARPKDRGRPVELVTLEASASGAGAGQAERPTRPATQYLPGVTPGYQGS